MGVFVFVPFFVCAAPISDRSIPERVAMVVTAYVEERVWHNVIVSASGLSDSRGHFLDPASVVSVSVSGAPAPIGLCVYPGKVVVYLTADGHPARASASTADKAAIDGKIGAALESALSSLTSVEYVELHLRSPGDPHVGQNYIPTNFDPGMLQRVRNQDGSPEALITAATQHAVRQASPHGAHTRGVWAIILPTPRNRLTRTVIDLTKPDALENSSLIRTLAAAQRELATAGVEGVRVLTPRQVSQMLSVFQLRDAGTVFTKAWLDREIAEARGHDPERPPYFPEHPFPLGVAAHSRPPAISPGFVDYDGNRVIALTLTEVNGLVPPGFLDGALQPSHAMEGAVVGYCNYVKLVPTSRARLGSNVRTRTLISARNLVETNPEIENIKIREELREEEKRRRGYHGAGSHTAQWQHYCLIVGATQQQAEDAYGELVKRLRRYFNVERLWLRKDVEEVYWLHFGIMLEAK
jgi:hypothetical protein